MKVYAVLSVGSQESTELFLTLDDAHEFITEVRKDEPDLAATLCVETIDLGVESLN